MLGAVTGGEERKLGELSYRYPIIRAERMYLWAEDLGPGGYPYYYGYPFMYGPPGFHFGGYWGRYPYDPFWW